MRTQYIIEILSEPQSQHPDRYLDVITDDLEWVMGQWGRNRHAFTYNIVEQYPAPQGADERLHVIKYKYRRDGDAIVTGSNA